MNRYARQIILKGIGSNGQQKLKCARVLIVGVGGIGSPVAYYCAAAGIGTIGLVDSDTVEISNLNRQIIHNEKNINQYKVLSAKEKLEILNSEIKILTYAIALDEDKLKEIIDNYDLIVIAVDNLETRYIVNKVCVEMRKPYVDAGIDGFVGYALTYIPNFSPCYNCIFPSDQYSRDKTVAGVIGYVPGLLGSIQVAEVVKIILGIGNNLTGKLLIVDTLTMDFKKIEFEKDTKCTICGKIESFGKDQI